MDDSHSTVAISPHDKDHKAAALFFDSIVPLSSADSVPNSVAFKDWERYVPGDKLKPLFERAKKEFDYSEVGTAEELADAFSANFHNLLVVETKENLAKNGVWSAPIFRSNKSYDAYTSIEGNEAIEVEIANFLLINTVNTEWEQIVAVRQDPDFRRKARNARLFLAENYTGKTKGYIEDSLAKKVEDYENACKRHGLELTLSTLKTTLNSKSLLATMALATTGLLLSQPLVVGATLLTGTVLEIGKLAITIAENRAAKRTLDWESEVAYLFELKRRL